MTLLNTTFCISPADREKFHSWVTEILIPAIGETPDAADIKYLKINQGDDNTMAFAVQFVNADEDSAMRWRDTEIPRLTAIAGASPYGLSAERLLHFTTLMEIL